MMGVTLFALVVASGLGMLWWIADLTRRLDKIEGKAEWAYFAVEIHESRLGEIKKDLEVIHEDLDANTHLVDP
jgi:hypothetical protein